MKKAVALVSGGMDSLVTLAVALQNYQVFPIHLNYKHRTERIEEKCFKRIIKHYGLKDHLIVSIDYLKKIGGSSLTDFSIYPEMGSVTTAKIPNSYVPFRNTHLLSIAVSKSEAIGAEAVFIGAVEEDSSGYPDCTKEYIESFNRLIAVGSKLGAKLKVYAPLIDMSKKDIVNYGYNLKVPFEHTWSCYVSQSIACGQCQSCLLRLKGFKEAGVRDPLKYN